MAKKAPSNVPAPGPTQAITLAPFPEAPQALSLAGQYSALSVVDQPSHQIALEGLSLAKSMKRKITDHWKQIKQAVDSLKRTVLDLEARDLSPVEAVIAHLDHQSVRYINEARAAAEAEARRLRLEAEALAKQQRDAELAEQEQRMAELEASSSDLSARELVFVREFVASENARLAALAAGYKDPVMQAPRLFASAKIQAAIFREKQLRAERDVLAAKKAEPLNVPTQTVTAAVGKTARSSMRTYYSCGPIDEAVLAVAWAKGDVPMQAMTPNRIFLNAQAEALKEQFEAAYPGCTLNKRQSMAG